MTLIAAVPCGDAFAISADSQETAGDYRGSVQKISPVDLGGLKAIVAGSGNADLIDSFIEKVGRRFQQESIAILSDFVLALEDELAKFYALDVAVCPAQDRSLSLFVGAANPAKQECGVWISKNITLVPLTEPKLIGWEEALYRSVIRRHAFAGMTRPQAILASLHTLVVAEETSNYVKGPFSVALVHPRGIFMEPSEDVQRMAQRLKEYEEQMKRVFVSCSDLATSSPRLKDQLDEFSSVVIALHEAHAEAETKTLFAEGFNSKDWPYSKIPSGVNIAFRNTGEIEVTQATDRNIAHRLEWETPEPASDPVESSKSEKLEDPT